MTQDAPEKTVAAGSLLIGCVAITHIHAGIGQALAAIDLPVARERVTNLPYIAGSSVKGAFRDAYRWSRPQTSPDKEGAPKPSPEELALFGATVADEEEAAHSKGQATSGPQVSAGAGQLLFSDMRLLLLPVRSLRGSFRWVTCPLILRRFKSDCFRAGRPGEVPVVADIDDSVALTAYPPADDKLFLEELVFTEEGIDEHIGEGLIETLTPLLPEAYHDELAEKLVILSDGAFAWFAGHGLPVRARNALDPETKRVKDGHLWWEESLSPDTLLYMVLSQRALYNRMKGKPQPVSEFQTWIENCIKGLLQIGGNETVGDGWLQLVVMR